ncbi:MAG: MerR family transcriptional regulator [Saprospiraceae bacterium]|nr:MerR family transcriptional regulator [Saprospiraceae bacterium]
MAVYSISDLEKLCGIKAHTIRIWEQRYGIVKPKRTKTNIRFYQDKDLRRLLNIALLNRNGFKISKIACMSKEEIQEKVLSISSVSFEHDIQLDSLTIAMIEMDETKLDKVIRTNIEKIGFERTMLELIYPFLEKLSVLWLTGSINPVQEGFMTYLLRQKLIAAIDRVPFPTIATTKKFMLFLPTGETQELSLLFLNYLLRSRGYQVIYLGQNITLDDLKDAFCVQKPAFLYTMISETYSNQSVDAYVSNLGKTFPQARVLVSGYQVVAQGVRKRENIIPLESLDQTLNFLNSLRVES